MNNSTPPLSIRKVIVLYNPFAGSGKSQKIAHEACTFIRKKNWQLVDCISSTYAGEIENKLALHAAQHADLVILIGGDGTLRELVSGLLKHEQIPEIAFIPMGNANVVARELKIPLNPLDALHLLNSSGPVEVDVGLVHLNPQNRTNHEKIFLAMLEIGVGAKIVHMVNALRLGKLKRLYQVWGDLVYALAGLLAFAGKPLAQVKGKLFKDEHTGEVPFASSHLVIANMRTYAKGWSFTPEASCRDGRLDLAFSKRSSRLAELAGFIAAANQRKQSTRLMHYTQAQQVNLSTSTDLFMQIDGDPVLFTGQAKISVLPKAFKLHAPRDCGYD